MKHDGVAASVATRPDEKASAAGAKSNNTTASMLTKHATEPSAAMRRGNMYMAAARLLYEYPRAAKLLVECRMSWFAGADGAKAKAKEVSII